MYQWHFADSSPSDDAVNGLPGELSGEGVFFDNQWTALHWEDSDDSELTGDSANGPFVADEVDSGEQGGMDEQPWEQSSSETDHELLDREQEQQIAADLDQAFAELQSQLVLNRRLLDDVYEHICHEAYDSNPADFDKIITLYDTLQVYEQLTRQDPRFEKEYFQVWQRLREQLAATALNRDFVLSLTDNGLQETNGTPRDWLAETERCKAQVFAVRNRFVSANIRLVYHVARRHLDKGMGLEDMVQEGVLGLMRAALKFDAGVGVRFSTYSFWWIKQAIRQAIARQRSLIRYPTHVNDQVNRIYGFVQDEMRRTGKKPSLSQIQKATGFSRAKVKDMLALTNFCVSASATLYDDGEKTLMDELSYDDTNWTPEEEVAASQDNDRLATMLSVLNRREAMILAMKFGIGHRRPYSLNEIAPQIGVSRERVRQIIDEAMTKIRNRFPEYCDSAFRPNG